MKKTLLLLLFVTIYFTENTYSQTTVRYYTSLGNFDASIRDDLQPITGGNFLSLVNSKFYDGIIFHRVVKDHFVQGGDPTGTGDGGPGYTIVDEFNGRLSNVQKSISMANAGPNTGGSQFFINTVDNLYLDPNYPVFGMVINGWGVVETIENVTVNSSYLPIIPVVMDSIRVLSPLMVEDVVKKSTLDIFPNPVIKNKNITIINHSEDELTEVILNSIDGTKVSSKTIFLPSGANEFGLIDLFTDKLSSGIYILYQFNYNISQKNCTFDYGITSKFNN